MPIKTPFQSHTDGVVAYEIQIGGGEPNGLATLTLNLVPSVTVPVTHTKVDGGYIMSNGRSPTTTIERCEFRSGLIDMKCWERVRKDLKCSLVIKPGVPPIGLQLWDGGLVEGGDIFRFMLVDENFHA